MAEEGEGKRGKEREGKKGKGKQTSQSARDGSPPLPRRIHTLLVSSLATIAGIVTITPQLRAERKKKKKKKIVKKKKG